MNPSREEEHRKVNELCLIMHAILAEKAINFELSSEEPIVVTQSEEKGIFK